VDEVVRYRYAGRSAHGERVRGEISAPSRAEAIRKLQAREVALTSLEAFASAASSYEALAAQLLYWWHGLRLRPAQLTFFRQMAIFEKNDVLLQRSLGLCMASCSNPRLREALHGVLADVSESGMKLHAAMAGRSGEFSAMMIAMVEAGEEGAGFGLVLARIATLLGRGKQLYGKVQRALYYPATVLLGVVGLVVWLVSNFIPQFTAIAGQYRQQPSADLVRLGQVGLLLSSPLALTVVLALALGVWFACRAALQQPTIAYWWDRQLYRLPLVGLIRKKAVLATLSRLLGAMLFAGVPYDRALELAAAAMPSAVYRRGLAEIRVDIRANGGTFAAAALKTGLFDPDYLALVAAGEQSKSAAEMLETIAADYDSDVERDLDAATAIIEPVLIVILGGLVMLVVGTVYGSLYSMMSHIR
jgi:type II secretory pathway component PulF